MVLHAFDTRFKRRDFATEWELWSEIYIQHSAHIVPGREGLFGLVPGMPPTLRYENALIFAEGDYVTLHGRFSGNGGSAALIAADIVRISAGRLAEQWDVLRDEAKRSESQNGLPMFGKELPI